MPTEPSAEPSHRPGDPATVFRRFLGRSWWWHASALLILMVVLTLRWAAGVLDPFPRPDEVAYVDAFAKVLEGRSPYELRYYLYPPPFAYGGAALTYVFGPAAVLALIRLADVFGGALLVWLGLGFLDLSWRGRVYAGFALCLVSPGLYVAMMWGNITPAVGSAMMVGLLAWRRRPVVSGLLLGLAGIAKPLTPVALVALGAHRPATSDRDEASRAHLVAAGVGLATGAVLALATPHLGEYLSISQGRPTQPRNVALHRLIWSAGLEVSSLWVVAFAALVAIVWTRSVRLDRFGLLAVATATALLGVPLIWSHTLIVTLPLQGLALQTALVRWRDGRERASACRNHWYELILVAIGCLILIFSDAADGPARNLVLIRTVYAGTTALTPCLLATYVVCRRPRR